MYWPAEPGQESGGGGGGGLMQVDVLVVAVGEGEEVLVCLFEGRGEEGEGERWIFTVPFVILARGTTALFSAVALDTVG